MRHSKRTPTKLKLPTSHLNNNSERTSTSHPPWSWRAAYCSRSHSRFSPRCPQDGTAPASMHSGAKSAQGHCEVSVTLLPISEVLLGLPTKRRTKANSVCMNSQLLQHQIFTYNRGYCLINLALTIPGAPHSAWQHYFKINDHSCRTALRDNIISK